MIKMFFSAFSGYFYVCVSSQKISVLNIKTGQCISGSPCVATKQNKVIAVGEEAEKLANDPDFVVKNGFLHDLVYVDDFAAAEAAIKFYINKMGISNFV